MIRLPVVMRTKTFQKHIPSELDFMISLDLWNITFFLPNKQANKQIKTCMVCVLKFPLVIILENASETRLE